MLKSFFRIVTLLAEAGRWELLAEFFVLVHAIGGNSNGSTSLRVNLGAPEEKEI